MKLAKRQYILESNKCLWFYGPGEINGVIWRGKCERVGVVPSASSPRLVRRCSRQVRSGQALRQAQDRPFGKLRTGRAGDSIDYRLLIIDYLIEIAASAFGLLAMTVFNRFLASASIDTTADKPFRTTERGATGFWPERVEHLIAYRV